MAKSKADLRMVVDNSPPSRAAERRRLARAGGDAVRHRATASRSRSCRRTCTSRRRRCEVFLEAFEGPLDLLLYLIRRQNLDILDIPIAEITAPVHASTSTSWPDMQLELAGEYLVMAATLAEIKSRMLLPRAADRTPAKRAIRAPSWCAACRSTSASRRAAEDIDRMPRMERDTWIGSAELGERKSSRAAAADRDAGNAAGVPRRGAARARCSRTTTSSASGCRCASACLIFCATLERASFVEFVHLFSAEEGRMGVTVTFVAILELVREGLIEIVQTEALRAAARAPRARQCVHLRLVPATTPEPDT